MRPCADMPTAALWAGVPARAQALGVRVRAGVCGGAGERGAPAGRAAEHALCAGAAGAAAAHLQLHLQGARLGPAAPGPQRVRRARSERACGKWVAERGER